MGVQVQPLTGSMAQGALASLPSLRGRGQLRLAGELEGVRVKELNIIIKLEQLPWKRLRCDVKK